MKTDNFINRRTFDYWFFFACIVIANSPLLAGQCWSSLVFTPQAINHREWWRLITHPFVHVSWYHLLLDASAFLVLYRSLSDENGWMRMGYVVASGMGSLLVSLWIHSGLPEGLCGLSGIAHGLMAIMGITLITNREASNQIHIIGYACFILVVGKCLVEVLTGTVIFSFMHVGNVGNPVACCHAGGVLGGLIFYASQATISKPAAL